jgi:hypothetical protein
MNNKKRLDLYAWIGLLAFFVLSLGLGFLLSIRLIFSEPNFLAQVAAQQAREQRIVKNVLILDDHPSEDDKARAISQLQRVLPVWERVQHGLLNGDAELGLPRRVPENIDLVLRQALPSFAAIDSAAKVILSKSDDAEVLRLQTITMLSQENDYDQKMAVIMTLEQQRMDSSFTLIAWIGLGILATKVALITALYFSLKRRFFAMLNVAQSPPQASA